MENARQFALAQMKDTLEQQAGHRDRRLERRDTGLSDVHLARMLRKVSSAERDAQLSSATRDAADKISIDLRKALDEYRP